jgi:redox-sensitive bicupin YhaK (pirin superfamily)
MIRITKANEHYHHEEGWLSTYWHFSFDQYRDPDKMNFGPLRVFNDDVIAPGMGFGFHPHRDMEIVTYVTEGELEHRDDQGNQGVIRAGEVQRMTAGSGIVHSEYNHSKEKPAKLLQVWIHADRRGLKPSWEQQKYTKQEREGRLLPVIVPEKAKDGGAMRIHQDAYFYVSSLLSGSKVDHGLSQGRKAYLFVIDGGVQVNGQKMETKDAARIEEESKVEITADKPTELILIDLPEEFSVNQ